MPVIIPMILKHEKVVDKCKDSKREYSPRLYDFSSVMGYIRTNISTSIVRPYSSVMIYARLSGKDTTAVENPTRTEELRPKLFFENRFLFVYIGADTKQD